PSSLPVPRPLWSTLFPYTTLFRSVSLYDHSHTAAALATALWRYHHDRQDDLELARTGMASRGDWDDKKFLLIQGDFFGVQSFILDRKSTRLNSSHVKIAYAVVCLK